MTNKLSHLAIAAKGSMKEVKHCLECGSHELAPINFSSNECLKCGYQQSIKLPKWNKIDRAKIRGLE